MKTLCEAAASPPFPVTHNLQPATSSRDSPKGFYLLSWPFSNASGSGMHMPTSFRARANARGLLAGPCGQVVNLKPRVKHWHFEGRMPEGFSPANASPLQLPQARFQIRPHAAPGTIEDNNGRGAACCARFWDRLFSDQYEYGAQPETSTSYFLSRQGAGQVTSWVRPRMNSR